MNNPPFRVKRYAHPKYKFLVRAKICGKWKRRYFTTRREAMGFAREQNAIAERYASSPGAAMRGPEMAEENGNAIPDVRANETEMDRQGRLPRDVTQVAGREHAYSQSARPETETADGAGGALEKDDQRLASALLNSENAAISRLKAMLQEARLKNGESLKQIASKADQPRTPEQARDGSDRLSAESAVTRSVEEELARTRGALERSRNEADRLAGVLEIRKANSAGLAKYKTRLERRLGNISEQMTAAGQVLKSGDPAVPSIVDLILQDIERIHDPSFWWKLAKTFGLLRLAHLGVPRSASERRTIANELKAGLREICHTLSSPATAPEEAIAEIQRLFQLRRQTEELLEAIKVSNLLRLKSPIWSLVLWARRTPNNLSPISPASALFDTVWYLGQNPAVAASELDPFSYYLKFGAREGHDPNPVFDTRWYLEENPDVAATELNPLTHYWDFGAREGRDPSPLFCTNWYLAENPDVAAAGINPLEHYLAHGAQEGRDPHPLFQSAWYLAQNPEIAGLNPLEHYRKWGCRHGCSPHPLFDAVWYAEQNGAVPEAAADPLRHYIDVGAREGRDPHPLFNSKWYLEQVTNRETARRNPLLHYLTEGAKAHLSPQPLFDPNYYADNWGESLPGVDLFAHYLTVGWRRRCKPCYAFDPDYYVKAYPDVAEKGLEPLTHFVLYGRTEGRVPGTDESSFDVYRPAFEISREPNIPTRPIASDVYAIAFYLPQFHRSPENDAWWGKGFTEWNNVRRGSANFEGHYQPHVPSALGYYDLEETDVLVRQAELAQSHGIHGFCFYYYWFAGKVLLDLPLRRLIETGQPDFPFCICWANENWTRRWDGKEEDVLISQQHSPEDDLAFIRNIEPVLLNRNYIRVSDKPMLLVYRPSLLPDAAATAERWRDYFRKRGHGELHLVMVRSFTEVEPATYGFDAMVQFPPHCHATPVTPLIKGTNPEFRGYVYDYTEIRRKFVEELGQPSSRLTVYAGVMPSWDNTARRARDSSIWVNSCPESYFEWISAAADLLRKRPDPNDRILFINAWNEWAEGCHLEPDERFGYAWLNATALALGNPGLQPYELAPSAFFPEPPIQKPIELEPLPSPLKLAISVLFYHREDIIPSFLRTLLPQIAALNPRDGTAIDLYLAFNYQPTTGLKADILRIVAESLPDSGRSVHFIENGFNIGFGEGHNAVFAQSESDIFLMINSDVRLAEPTWLRQLVELFRGSEAAIVGLAATASRLRNDACGVPIVPGTQDFDFVDGSLLAVRSDLARRYGLFSEAFDYFYFEDADLCLRYRQLGLRLALLDLPYEHDRGSSSRLFPQYAMENVLNRNRARFFQRWEHYLQTRQIPNRLAVRFLNLDRQLQCASLPAILRLLSEHPGAILDLAGIHQQLAPLFQHPRIRIIPSWQTLREGDYLRSYQVEEDHSSEQPRVTTVAARLGCTPDLEGTREHLRSLLLPAARDASAAQGQALLVVPRQDPLFEGRQPAVASFAALEEFLSGSDWAVNLLTDLGWFEVEKLPYFRRTNTTCSGRSSGLEILQAVADSDLVVSCDNWIAELGQLLDKKTFVWFGATSSSRSLWNLERVAFFSDRALPCLGCYHRFGKDNRNTCLRGDIACMRQEAVDAVILALRRFLDGMPMTAVELGAERLVTGSAPSKPSSILRLDYWPASRAASVLVLIPANPKLDKEVLQQAEAIAQKAIHGMQSSRVVLDENGVSPPRGVPHPARQQAMAAIRQAMVDRHLKDERWVFWVDADIVQYRAHLIDELISRAEGGIAAPLVLMKGAISEPLSNKYGFGPGRFYDVAGFVENGRWARFTQPYFDQPGPVYDLDSVGSCYLVNADLYRNGAKHEADFASKKFIEDNCVWQEDSIAQNQAGSANCFSEHYSVCEFARQTGLPVRAFADLVAYHAKPAAPSRGS